MPAITIPQLSEYRQDGYVIVRQMFDQTEIQLLQRAAKLDRELEERSYSWQDAGGLSSVIAMESPCG